MVSIFLRQKSEYRHIVEGVRKRAIVSIIGWCANGGRCAGHKGSAAARVQQGPGVNDPINIYANLTTLTSRRAHPKPSSCVQRVPIVIARRKMRKISSAARSANTKSETPPLCLSQLNAGDRVQIFASLRSCGDFTPMRWK